MTDIESDRPVSPAYVGGPDSPLVASSSLYGPIGHDTQSRKLQRELVIPVRSGRAWAVPAGSVCRFTIIEGPQVLDLNLWSLHDPRERFWAARTRQFYGAHLSTGGRLWSNLPFLRPMATVVADTMEYGRDGDGAGCHDLLGTRCDPYVNQLLAGTAYDFHCHSNLTRAVLSHGLTEFDIHDVINIFQITGLTDKDELYFMKSCPARVGDHFELFAEIDLLMAASTCPGGDLAVPLWGPDAGGEPNCNPIKVEVFQLDESLLRTWRSPHRASYLGGHGLSAPNVHPPLTAAVPVPREDVTSGGGAGSGSSGGQP